MEYLIYSFYSILGIIIFLTYFGYPIFISIMPSEKPKRGGRVNDDSRIFLLIPFFNEREVVSRKVLSSLDLKSKYPIQVFAISDRSEDGTDKILSDLSAENDRLTVLLKDERKGKNDSLNYGVKNINPMPNDILVFTDANTFFSSKDLDILIDDLKKGSVLVGGSMVYVDSTTGTAKSEGLYWRYEEWIRQNESRSGNLIVVNGGLFAMMASHYEHLESFVPNDFDTPLKIVSNNHVTFNSQAKGVESAIKNSKEEFARKKRMANRQMNCIMLNWERLSYGIKFRILFHKIFRWAGWHLYVALSLFAIAGFLVQLAWFDLISLFHLFIVMLYWTSIPLKNIKIFSTIYHAVGVHRAGFSGALNALLGRDKVTTWEKAISNREGDK